MRAGLGLSFVSGLNNNTVAFEEDGDAPPNYKILNFQKSDTGSYSYVEVGSYELDSLDLDYGNIRFSTGSSDAAGEPVLGVPESLCSRECPEGQVKILQNLVSSFTLQSKLLN